MSLVDVWTESQKGVALFGKVKCPINYMLKPGCDPFKRIPNKRWANVSDRRVQELNERYNIKIKRWIYARDSQGNKIQDRNSYYQPEVSKAYIVEHVYDPLNPICKLQCKGRCLRGVGGTANTLTIKRFNKSPLNA